MMKFLALIGYSMGIALDCWLVKHLIMASRDDVSLDASFIFIVVCFSYLLISRSHIILFPQDVRGISILGSTSSDASFAIEKEILRYAKSGKRELTAIELAVDSNYSVAEIQKGLDALVDLDVAVLKTGERESRCFEIRGFLTEQEKNAAIPL